MGLAIFSYICIGIFLLFCLRKAIKYATMPIHLRWELYPVPHESPERAAHGGSYFEDLDWWTKDHPFNLAGEVKAMAEEILLLKGVREKNPKLWIVSYPFHLGLYALVVWVALLLVGAFIIPAEGATGLAAILSLVTVFVGMVGLVLTLVGAIGLLLRRLTDEALRNLSAPLDFINLLLIGGFAAAAILAWFTADNDFGELRAFAYSLMTLSTPAVSGVMVKATIVIGSIFLAWLPFTHMTHMFTKYFTYHAVRWNDKVNLRGSGIEKQIEKSLKYPVSWSAPHIAGDGKKNWVDVAMSDGIAKAED